MSIASWSQGFKGLLGGSRCFVSRIVIGYYMAFRGEIHTS